MIWHNWPLKKPKFGQQITFNYKVLEDLGKKKKNQQHPDGVLTQTINKWIVKVIKISNYNH